MPPPQHAETVPEIGRRRTLLSSIRRHIVFIVIFALYVAAMAGAISYFKSPDYSASSEVLVKSFQSFSSQVDGAATASDRSDPSRVVATQAKIVTLPVVAARVAKSLGLPASEAEALSKATSVATDVNSDILTVTTHNGDASLAPRIANAFATEFVNYRGELDTEGLTGAARDVDARLETLAAQGQESSDFYLQLQRTREQLRTQILLGTRNASLVQPAQEAVKVGPRPLRSALIAGLGALFLAAILAWAVDLIDRRLRNEADVAELFGAPILARVPRPGRKAEQRNEIVMLDTPESAGGEAYRLLSSMLQMSNVGGGPRVVLLASADSGEGKTTTALNLAVALARAGRTVAVCDLDLRAPAVMDRLGLGPHPGVTNILMGDARLEEALVAFPLPHAGSGAFSAGRPATIGVLGSGPRPPNPADFILAPELADLLSAMRARHDVTIVDAPPWLSVSDGLALAPLADVILTVTKIGVTKRTSLANFARALQSLPTPVVGQVLTNYPVSRETSYGYGNPVPTGGGAAFQDNGTLSLSSRLQDRQ